MNRDEATNCDNVLEEVNKEVETRQEDLMNTSSGEKTKASTAQPEVQSNDSVEELGKPLKKNHKKLMIAAIAAVVIIAGAFGIKLYMDDQAHKAYVKEYNEYLDHIQSAQSYMLNGGADAESVNFMMIEVWSNAIWKTSDTETDSYTKVDGTFVNDFNTAISNYRSDPDTITKTIAIEREQILAESDMEALKNPPKGLEGHYEAVEELYDVYVDFTNLALNPSGSLKIYQDNVIDLHDDFLKLYKKTEKLDMTKLK